MRCDRVLDAAAESDQRRPLVGFGQKRETAERLIRGLGTYAAEDSDSTAGRYKRLHTRAFRAGVKQDVVMKRVAHSLECGRLARARQVQVAEAIGVTHLTADARVKVLAQNGAEGEAIGEAGARGAEGIGDRQIVVEAAAGNAADFPFLGKAGGRKNNQRGKSVSG